MRLSYVVLLFVISISLIIFSCCKKTPCPTCPPAPTDSTSHNFVFQQYAFGESGSSTLYDVAIINDTIAYAVGAVYLRDSSGRGDPQPYNLAKWDGQQWKLQKLLTNGFPPPIKSILVFNEHDIWLDPWFHYDGQNFQEIPSDPIFFGIGIGKMWGTSSSDLYVVGTSGFIAHFNGSTWTKIESGTTLDIYDIYGAYNPYSLIAKWEILAVASSYTPSRQERKLLQIYPLTNGVSQLDTSGLAISLHAIWFVPNKLYLSGGDGLYHKDNIYSTYSWQMYPVGPVTNYYTERICGNDVNDIFIAGDFLELLHYNGSSWYNYRTEIQQANGAFGGVALKGNLVIAVGLTGSNAIAVVGRRGQFSWRMNVLHLDKKIRKYP
jgi:hypothetical protein